MSKYRVCEGDTTESDSDVPIICEKKPIYTEGLGHGSLNGTYGSINKENGENIPEKDESSSNSKCQNAMKVISSVAVETALFVYMFSYMMRATITTSMMMDKACQFRLNYSSEICADLSNHTDEKDEVEKIASNFNLYLNLLHMGPGALVMMFVGPWSDKYGRKPPVLVTIVGTILDDVGMILNAYFFEAKLEYMLLSSVPTGITGGFICLLTVMFSLVSELNTKTKRTLRFAFAELAFGLGMTCGSLVGGLIYDYSKSYIIVYGATITGHAIAGLWVVLVISETKGLNSAASLKQKICDVLTFERIVEGFKVCIKPRENHGRSKIWLLFGSVCAIVLTYESFSNIGYTYAHHRFNWDPATFNYITSVIMGVGLIFMLIFVPLLTRVFKISDAGLGIVGTLSAIAKNVCIGLASKPWIYYFGNIVGLLFALATLAPRSMLSKLVPEDELGKVFSFMSMCEALVPLAGSIAITKIFNATISVFPGLCYLVAAALLVFPLGAYTDTRGLNQRTAKWIATLKSKEYQTLKVQDDFPTPTH